MTDAMTDLEATILDLARRARAASVPLAALDTATKDAWLLRCSERLEAAKATILAANERDMQEAREKEVAEPLVNRLSLSGGKWQNMLQGLRDVAALPDPVGRISELSVRPNGLRVGRMQIPLGVIGMIYESRPNVTVDAAALCVKAGNAVILRGGSEAFHSNQALGAELRAAAVDVGVPEDAIGLLPTTDRAAIDVLIRADRYVDLIIPRGGHALVRRVRESSTIPVIAHDEGVCHVYVDPTADAAMAAGIAVDSKIEQMAVCNALETILFHADTVERQLPHVLKALHEQGVEIRGCARTCAAFPEAKPASDSDWPAEYLAKIVAARVVDSMDEAIEHIHEHGSDHTEILVTNDYAASQEWVRRVRSSCVGVNCSTAFSDGFRLGLGAEIGISTSRLHAYGPMGLEGLTSKKFVIFGDGQLRE